MMNPSTREADGRRRWWRVLVVVGTVVMNLGLLSAPSPAGDRPDEPRLRGLKEHRQHGSREFRIATVSTRNDVISGGDVLVRIDVAPRIPLERVVIDLNDVDITLGFQRVPGSHALLGLVAGLQLGDNSLTVSQLGRRHGARATLTLTNYPIAGPIFSGPHETPFICTTASMELPDGSFLGAALDANCSAATRVHYVYRTTGAPATFRPLPSLGAYPADLAFTTTTDGRAVPYIVRVETGTINRSIYQTAILHDPVRELAPSPFAPPAGWNRKLIYQLGGGCQGGWYTQGLTTLTVPGLGTFRLMDPLNDARLRQGYAVATSTLNVFANNCNDLLSSETTRMVKERFIEAYGVPLFTIGTGGSGGAYQSNQTADAYPGVFDGIITSASFPDVTTGIITLADARLLDVYFNQTALGLFTVEQQRAVSGFSQVGNITFLSRDSITSVRRIDPVEAFPAGFPSELRYDPVTNPLGARATVYDHTVNVYGKDRDTGFARRPLDNVGVQYGLKALNDGVISVEQFLDLNERIGGFDIDLRNIPGRTVADVGAVRRGYRSGRILNGGGGLATTPIITQPGFGDRVPTGDIHLKFHSFSIRERLIKANGHADNQVIVGPGPIRDDLFDQMDRWLAAILSDGSHLSTAQKVVRNKPADLVDACWTSAGVKIIEPQTAFGPGQCNQLYPASLNPALVSGVPLASDIIKCQLKAIDPSDYSVALSSAQIARLARIFRAGVCDWSKPGVGQTGFKTWASFGPAPDDEGRADDDEEDR